jgi:cell division protein FtsL
LEKEIEMSKLIKKRKRKALEEKEKDLEYQNNELEKQAVMKGKIFRQVSVNLIP